MTSQSASTGASIAQNIMRTRSIEQRQRFWGWVFLSPWIIGFLAFTAFPIAASLVFSFTDFKIGEEISWVGLKNWQNLLVDPATLQSLGVTLKFGIIALPVSIIFPLMLAALLNSKYVAGKPILRVLFYMPYMVPAISGVFIWQSFLNGQTGWLNRLLRLLNIADPPNWLFDTAWIHPAMVLIGLWGVGNAMLTMLASMQGVPTELYEAADVDGAGPFTKFRKITLPMISPVILYNLVLTTIGLMQYFVVPFVLSSTTRSNPDTNFINLYLYRTAFQFFDMGYAATLAWFLFAIGLLLTIGIFATSRRWVYYSGGEV
ncbi:MAG: sugar ABC transporter permease [Anaerolineaceae bacterium]|nr:sugar ABC transporter permease [Anaerolineaceae bacterium]